MGWFDYKDTSADMTYADGMGQGKPGEVTAPQRDGIQDASNTKTVTPRDGIQDSKKPANPPKEETKDEQKDKADAGKTTTVKTEPDNAPSGSLYHVGYPPGFSNDVDPKHRIYNYLKAKMSLVDLVPCYFGIDMSAIGNSDDLSGFLPSLMYKDAVTQFKQECKGYGLPDDYIGVRLYSTDETIASDTVTNTMQDNFFQKAANSLSDGGMLASVRQILRSVDNNSLNDLNSGIQNTGLTDKIKSLGDQLGGGKVGNVAKGVSNMLLNTIITGHKISFPKIWSDSNYVSNMPINIQLTSPYGHPDAIKEFIIKPLMYLMILGGSKTKDGVSYGPPFPVTVCAYGMFHTPIGNISAITLRRGGNDSSFNIYKQPLTVSVTIDIELLVKGFGVFHFS